MEKNKNYLEEYGTRRVIEPASVLPPSAWRLDNRREIYPDEIRIMVKRVHLEPTSFKQISLECGNDEAKMRRKILDITLRRGKLHNPVTDTGGLPEFNSSILIKHEKKSRKPREIAVFYLQSPRVNGIIY